MKSTKASLVFLFITASLDTIGLGIIIPSLPQVIRRFITNPKEVSEYFGFFISIYALMQFMASPILGALSDYFGRRPILLISLIAAAIDYLLMAFAPSLSLLFLGRAISGLTGASITVCMSYAADISTAKTRSSNYGAIGAAIGLGFVVGPALGGFLGKFSPEYPFMMAALLNLLNFIFGIFILPESLSKEKRSPLVVSKFNPLKSFAEIFKNSTVLSLALIHFLFQMASQTHPSIWTLYTTHRFGWSSVEVGFSLSLVGILMAVSQGWATRIIIPIWGEYKTLIICSFCNIFAFLGYGLAYQSWMLYLVIVTSAFLFIAQPTLQAIASKNIAPQKQGEFQGALVSLTSLASILNPLITTRLFSYFSNHGSTLLLGVPYFFAATLSLAAWIIIMQKRERFI